MGSGDGRGDRVAVTELRIHGVGGATPEDMLNDPAPRLVAGDRIAGFYRGRDLDGRHVEAYSWGGLTSRKATRAVWLIMLPFALANLAGWMLRGESLWPRRWLRVGALALTVTFVLWVSSIWLDLVGYQCGAQPGCTAGRWWLVLLRVDAVAPDPARRLVVAAAAPLLLIGLLLVMARATRKRYEERPPTATGGTGQTRRIRDLADPRFWNGHAAEVLSHLHVGAALATLTAVLASTGAALEGYAERPLTDLGWWLLRVLGLGGGLLVLAVAAVLMLTGQAAPLDGRDARKGFPGRFLRGLPWMAFALLLATAAVLVVWQPGTLESAPASLPGLRPIVQGVFAAGLAPLIVVGVCMAGARLLLRGRQSFRGGWLVPATIAHLMVNALFAGAAVRSATFLGAGVPTGGVVPAGATPPVIFYPAVYGTMAVGLFVLLVAFILSAAVWWWVGWRRSRKELTGKVKRQYQHAPDPAGHPGLAPVPPDLRRSVGESTGWLRGVARWWSWSAAVDRVDAWLAGGVGVGLVAAGAYLGWRWVTGEEPLRFQGSWSWLLTLSTLLLAFIPTAGLLLFTYAYRDPEWRRQVGRIWDVATFWPRAYHPLAPPSYAERAVPDLTSRIIRLTAAPDQRLIISAHSQGSVLALAALEQVDPSVLAKVALVTHGSPLARLYGKAFPAHLGGGRLAGLWKTLDGHRTGEVTRWKNFWRATDFIGGPVFTGDDDLEQADTTPFPLRADEALPDPATCHYVLPDPPPRVMSHFDYLEPDSPPGTQDLRGFLATLTTAWASPPAPEETRAGEPTGAG